MNEAKEAVCGEYAEVLQKEIAKLRDINKDLREALQEIAKGEGAFNREPLKHAENTIQNMKGLAEAAIAKCVLSSMEGK